jgi:plastocyanin
MIKVFSRKKERASAHPLLLFFMCTLLVWCNQFTHALAGVDSAPIYGSLSGTIQVEKTKVKTAGPKSDKEVLVYLEKVNGTKPPPVDTLMTMDQKGLIFIPHVLPVQVGTTVEFLNNDTVEHNVYFLSDKTGKTLDLGTWPQGVSVKYRFNEEDVVIVLCKLHLEMAAYVVAVDTPYFTTAVLDEESQKASFKIGEVLPGKYLVHTWHKKLLLQGGPREIQIEDGSDLQTNFVITKRKYAR